MENMSAILYQLALFVPIIVIFYFLLVLPEKKRKKKYQGMLQELKVNDEVVTRGGIIGKITHMDENTITLETSPAKTRIKFEKSGIAYKMKAE
ncbi:MULTISPECIES: preprotein translocase subunit YajC [Clostridium]|jgi:preprotein translocase subunit YajC|uniref:Protein translocase subunit yajC n=1 Tax=Clostridium saccharoperbutylacetonicum N1-4(HMT) TaxID=931276 RepID=M1LTI0_9CLOT|nr:MULTISPECIES: preprotein translocase subunit YajC [Clostridium]AGF56325.1 protein translocase subunit yajC [Clostridium saccharoperbutylacetonicum N1-4(HMT)]AQR95065.1 preprotein translocase subunit YajC [Clostridium saccharoperbutylacetonicum]NRT62931.1 preprotein translocase subunit YajC [Clostridium saccharoperbutylacetonicum]NSB26288.1 preprotein translocase subunit YajC [Clostridium saccharoperbutylacetonicum]NSB30912.1 preprotein translocase subunit YajC [Clostridium saccharoperbutyla